LINFVPFISRVLVVPWSVTPEVVNANARQFASGFNSF